MKSTRVAESKRKGGPGFPASIFVLLLGAFFFIFGTVDLVEQINFASHGATTTATVVGFHTHSTDGKNGCTGVGYNPVVTFTDSGGRQATATLSNKQICDKPAKGEAVRVEYDTSNPSQAKFPTASNWTDPIAAVVIGGLLLAGGVAMAVSTVRQRRAVERGEPIPGSKNQRKKREREQTRQTACRDRTRTTRPQV